MAPPARNGSLLPNPLAPAARSAEAEALDRLADSEMLRALRDLPEESRVAVYLADIEGYAYKIAQIMGTPIGTVMSRLHRGGAGSVRSSRPTRRVTGSPP
jgi:DNA-directed RNA polymerase specialized sigma24 family protein